MKGKYRIVETYRRGFDDNIK